MASADRNEQYSQARSAQKFFGDAIKACFSGDVDGLTSLLDKYLADHPEVTADDVFQNFETEGKTLFHLACSSSHLPIVEFILSRCKNTETLVALKDGQGFTPLINATVSESIDVMSCLIRLGANVNAQNSDGASSLHFAAADGSLPRMTVLLIPGRTSVWSANPEPAFTGLPARDRRMQLPSWSKKEQISMQ